MLKCSEKCYEQVANPEELGKIAETETAEEPTSPRFDQVAPALEQESGRIS